MTMTIETPTELPLERFVGVKYFRLNLGTQWYIRICGKCGGTGFIQAYAYIEGGQCFKCGGSGRLGGPSYTSEGLDRLQAALDKKEAAKERKRLAICAKRDARVAAFAAVEPELAAVLQTEYDGGEGFRRNAFYSSLASQLHDAVGKELTEKQVEALRKSVGDKAVRAEAAKDFQYLAEEGEKVSFTGRIIRMLTIQSDFGTSLMVLVHIDDTHEVKMFTGAQWAWDAKEDEIVSLKGTVKRNEEFNGQKVSQIVRPTVVKA